MRLFGREPTLWLAVVIAIISVAGTFGFRLLSPDQAGLWVRVINGLAGAINAYTVRPVAPAAFTYVAGTLVALGAAYGFELDAQTVMAINAALVPILALATRGQVAPVETTVTNASPALRKPEVDAT